MENAFESRHRLKRPSPSPGSRGSSAVHLTALPHSSPQPRLRPQEDGVASRHGTFAEHLTRHSVVEGRHIQSIKREREREITAFLLLGSLMESVW